MMYSPSSKKNLPIASAETGPESPTNSAMSIFVCQYRSLYKVDPEIALRETNAKFVRRFQYIEQHAPAP